MSKMWQAKPDHPPCVWLVFVREKVAGHRKLQPRLACILPSPLAAIVSGIGRGLEELATKLKVPARRIEVVCYSAKMKEGKNV